MSQTVWAAPPAPRPAGWAPPQRTQDVTSKASLARYRRGEHYSVIEHNRGQTRDVPIFVAKPNVIEFDHAPAHSWPCARYDVPNVPGAFVITDALTPHECEQMLAVSEAMGYAEDAPVSLGRDIRHNESCTWIADDTVRDPIFERVRRLLPPEVAGGAVAGLNGRFRLYKYNPQDVFKPHTDGSWPGTGVVNGRVAQDAYNDRWSQLTFLLYLNDDMEGGATTFHLREDDPLAGGSRRVARGVKAAQGSVLCFYHGEHPLSPLHEGSLVTAGTKYVVRTDVLYVLGGGGGRGEL
jgi:hypothetical protein